MTTAPLPLIYKQTIGIGVEAPLGRTALYNVAYISPCPTTFSHLNCFSRQHTANNLTTQDDTYRRREGGTRSTVSGIS
jgi:hypothetical protein